MRFLNEVGGGVVTGFQGRDVVLVEDADGFDIPVRINECVVIEEKKEEHALFEKSEPISAEVHMVSQNGKEEPIEVKHPSFVAERRGGDVLNLYLCFVPVEVTSFSKTDFDVYFINDSNYFIDFVFVSGESGAWQLRYHGTAEPNTKVYMETIGRESLNDIQHLCVQAFAYKENKTFQLKQPVTVELRPDLTKFYKLHTFTECDFFDERILMFDIVTRDVPAIQFFANAEDLRNALLSPNKEDNADDQRPRIHAIAVKHPQKENLEVIDLHAAELLDNMHGLSAADILEYQKGVFNKKMQENMKNKGKKLIFIHGKGQGVLRNAILKELNHKYKGCTSQDASFREYGFGATMVIIH